MHRASGVSIVSYWIANFIFDYSISVIQTLLFTISLYCSRAEVYSGNDFGLIFGIGLLFNWCVIQRFYLISNFITDIKMAQTYFFYGSLLSQFILVLVYSLVVYTFLSGDATTSSAQIVGIVCTSIDPAFGYLFLILLQNDFLGVRTQEYNASITDANIGANILYVLLISGIVYFIAIIYVEIGFSQVLGFFKLGKKTQKIDNSSLTDDMTDQKILSIDNTETKLKRQIGNLPNERTVGMVDPDVLLEKNSVFETFESGKIGTKQNAVFVHKLSKIFYGRGSQPTKVAVKDLSLNIAVGEIFGLLGANGAGKVSRDRENVLDCMNIQTSKHM